MKITIIGVHPVGKAPEPCHLIELVVEGTGELVVGSITQPQPELSRENWQAPYDEYRLAPDGRSGEPLGFAPVDVHGQLRMAFFFHFLSLTGPLWTPVGPVALPRVTPRPRRLRFMMYEPPS